MESSLNTLIHCESGEIRRLGEFHFLLLETFITHADVVLSREFLMSAVWKNRVVGNNSLPTAIHALRVAVGDDGKQQEIIKTIPKKGYVLNKAFVIYPHDEADTASPAEKRDDIAATPFSAASIPRSPPHNDALNLGDIAAPNKKARRLKNKLFSRLQLVCAMLMLAGIMTYASDRAALKKNSAVSAIVPPSSAAILVTQESYPAAHNITLYHFYRRGEYKQGSSALVAHSAQSLEQIDTLLNARHATLTLYYYVSFQRYAIDLLVKNSCQQVYQLSLNIRNWQGNDEKLGHILYQETERTLNEMPTCH